MHEFRAQYSNERSSARRARIGIIGFASGYFAGEDLADIEYAVGEALANATEHGHEPGSFIDVVCRIEPVGLTIEVCDKGAGFSHEDVVRRARPEVESPRGYGLFLMRRLMDHVEYRDGGRTLQLTKRMRDARSLADESLQIQR